MPRLSQAILIHRYTFPIENKKEDRGYRMWKILKCHHLNVIESFWKHGVQWSCCLERCFVSSLRHSKPNESYKKHLPSQWTPDSFTLGLDSNVAPLQQEQSWERQLRNFSGLWQATLSHYISKPHIVWKRGNSFQGGQILSPTLSGQAGPGRRILMQKLPSILFPRPSEFSSSSWLFLRVWQASYWLWNWLMGHCTCAGINFSSKWTLKSAHLQGSGSPLSPPGSPPPSLLPSPLSLSSQLLGSLVFLTLGPLPWIITYLFYMEIFVSSS